MICLPRPGIRRRAAKNKQRNIPLHLESPNQTYSGDFLGEHRTGQEEPAPGFTTGNSTAHGAMGQWGDRDASGRGRIFTVRI